MWLIATVAVISFYSLYIYTNRIRSNNAQRKEKIVLAVMGSGGHTAEMIELLKNLDVSIYKEYVYVLAETDKLSSKMIEGFETARGCNICYMEKIPRSREVGQSWITTIFTSCYAVLCSFPVMWKHKPDLILMNGPGTCIPIAFIAIFLNALGVIRTYLLYEESICRVYNLSLSGLILYYTRAVDDLIVQWPQLALKYPRSKYIENLS